MLGDDLDHALSEKVVNCPSCHANVAPHALRDDGAGDELVVRNLLLELLVQVLVEENGSVQLLLLLALGPLLLLGLAAATRVRLLGLAAAIVLVLLGGLWESITVVSDCSQSAKALYRRDVFCALQGCLSSAG